MRIAIHQPQFFPWLPYFLKAEESDLFVLLDTVDYQKNGLQNRNQIKTAQGAHWLTVPVKQGLGQRIADIEIAPSQEWRRTHWRTILQNYGQVPAFEQFGSELEALYSKPWNSLCELNVFGIRMMMNWMGIRTPVVLSSQMQASGAASDLVLNICLEVGATEYLSGMGGKNYLESWSFEKAGVQIIYRRPALALKYPQRFPKVGFLSNLSALDLLLNCGDSWRRYVPHERTA